MHTCIFGQTESGKSTLAKRLIKQFQAQGYPCIVFDPLHDPQFEADLTTSDLNEFLDYVFNNQQCMIFIDEAGAAFSKKNVRLEKVVTMGRHWGHSVFILAQRFIQVPPTIRNQASAICLFNSSLADGKNHSEEWNEPAFIDCPNLRRGEYFYKARFQVVQRNKLFS